MSYFGDDTAQQAVFDVVEDIQSEFGLSREQIIIVILSVIQAIIDPYDVQLDAIREGKT